MAKLTQTDSRIAPALLAETAMKQAVEKALDGHARAGNPVYVLRAGKVVEIMPPEILQLLEKLRA